jgi:HTH-type transcriptional regulator/antitoxin HipB
MLRKKSERFFLKQRRLDLTQAQLAKRLRRYQSFVATVESGQRRIDVIKFLDLAEAVGFDPIDVIKKLRAAVRSQQAANLRRPGGFCVPSGLRKVTARV